MSNSQKKRYTYYSVHDYFKEALDLFNQGEFSLAFDCLDTAIILSHHCPFYIYQKTRKLFELGHLKACLNWILSNLEHLYHHSSLYLICRTLDFLQRCNHYTNLQLQTLLHEREIPYCLAKHYKTWLTCSQKDIFNLAKETFENENYSLCASYCELYLRYYSHNASIIYYAAYSYQMACNVHKAKEMYTLYDEQLHHSPESIISLALILMEAQDYISCIHYLKELLTIEPHNILYLSYLAECYYQAQCPAKALSVYKQLLKIDPHNRQVLFDLYHLYRRLEKKWLAKHYLKQAQKKLP